MVQYIPPLGFPAYRLFGMVSGNHECSVLQTYVFKIANEAGLQVFCSHHIKECLPVINSGNHCFVGPYLLSAHCRVIPQPHSHRPSIINYNFFHGAHGPDDRTMGNRASMDGVEITMQPTPRHTLFSEIRGNEKLNCQKGRYSHAFPVTGGTGAIGCKCHNDLKRLAAEMLVHHIEHGPLAQFRRPYIRLMFFIDLHIGDILIGDLDLRRVRRAPESGPHQFFGEWFGITEQSAQLAKSHQVPLVIRRNSLGSRVAAYHEVFPAYRIPVHAEAVLPQLKLIESRSR